TLVMVTHDVDEAIVLADRVMVMRPRPGRVYEEIACDLPRPRDRQSAAFDFVKRRVLAALDRSLDRAVVTDDGETRAAAGGRRRAVVVTHGAQRRTEDFPVAGPRTTGLLFPHGCRLSSAVRNGGFQWTPLRCAPCRRRSRSATRATRSLPISP